MTSIAGYISGHGQAHMEIVVSTMLNALPGFKSHNRQTKGLDGAVFGRTASMRVPEDRYDRQPLLEAGRYLLVADVRLDNRDELIPDLYSSRSLATHLSDADILLRAWHIWQVNSLSHIRGDFAFAVYDQLNRTVTLVRDPTGQRPLFYTEIRNEIAFASMPSGVLATPFATREFDRDWLVRSILGFAPSDDRTAFVDIKRVRPGHIVTLAPSSSRVMRFWWPPTDPLQLSDAEFVEAYHFYFERAVHPCLRRAQGSVGVHLSSGFDSSAVALTAARLAKAPRPIAFTSGPRENFRGPVLRGYIADESQLASMTAQLHELHHCIVRSSGHPLLSLSKNARIYQEPIRNVVNMETGAAILRAAADQDVSTMLTGASGNVSIHWGGLYVLGDWLRIHGWVRWLGQARAARNIPGVRLRGILFNSFEGVLPASIPPLLDRLFNGVSRPDRTSFLRREFLGRTPVLVRRELSDFPAHDSYTTRLSLIDYQDPGLNWMGAFAEFGVDQRDPTSDRNLIDFSFQLPSSQLLKDGVSRPLLRRALTDHLPRPVLQNPLRGAQGADWFEQIRPQEVREILEEVSGSALVNELFDLNELREILETLPNHGWTKSHVIIRYHNALTNMLSNAVFIDQFERMICENRFEYISL